MLRSTELRLGTIGDADEDFSRDEGEDDRTLQSWLREHRRYWERTCAARGEVFSDEHEIVVERFRVVWPPEISDWPPIRARAPVRERRRGRGPTQVDIMYIIGVADRGVIQRSHRDPAAVGPTRQACAGAPPHQGVSVSSS